MKIKEKDLIGKKKKTGSRKKKFYKFISILVAGNQVPTIV